MRNRLLVVVGLAGLVAVVRRRKRPSRSAPATQPDSASTAPLVSARFGKRHGVYALLLVALLVASIIAAALLLTVRSPPEGESQRVGIGFAVTGRPTFEKYGIYTFGEALAHQRNREPEPRASQTTSVAVDAAGCSNPVAVTVTVQLDPRWLRAARATAMHERLVFHTSYEPGRHTITVPHPNVSGTFALEVTEHATHVSAALIEPAHLPIITSHEYQTGSGTNATVITGRLPPEALRHVSPNDDFQSGVLSISFLAPWLSPRGYQSCFLRLPSLLGNYVFTQPFVSEDLDSTSDRPLGPTEGRTELTAAGSEVDLSATNPAPNSSGRSRLWTCSSQIPRSPQRYGPDCHATVVLTRPNESAHLQLLTVLLAAILSGAVLAIGSLLRRYFLGL